MNTAIYQVVNVGKWIAEIVNIDNGQETTVSRELIVNNQMETILDLQNGVYLTDSQETGFFVVIQPE